MSVPCNVCGHEGSRLLFVLNDYPVLACLKCGHQFADVALGTDFTTRFYSEDYFTHGDGKCGYADYLGDKTNHLRMGAHRVQFVERFVKRGALLDVGCAAGFFLQTLGPTWDGRGCEPAACMAGIAREHFPDRVSHCSFEDYPTERSFNVITMWDCIEHVPDAAEHVRKAHALLKPGGYLFIGTPDAGSVVARVMGRRWYHYGPPAHLHYFSRKTMTLLLERHGFTVVKRTSMKKYVSLSDILMHLGFVFRERRIGKRLIELSQANALKLDVPFNVFDDMVVAARKV